MSTILSVKRILLCSVFVLFCVCLCSCNKDKTRGETHDEALNDWLKQYNCSFEVLSESTQDETTIYTCKSTDERAITFLVTCWDGLVEIPFAFHIPVKSVYTSDTFADALSEYISTTVEELSYDNQSLDEIEDCILEVMDEAYDIFEDYNIQGWRPTVTFKIVSQGRTIDFVCQSLDREFVRSTLINDLSN